MTKTAITIDMDFETLEEALTVAEAFTEADCEVTKPLGVAGRYSIRVEADHGVAFRVASATVSARLQRAAAARL